MIATFFYRQRSITYYHKVQLLLLDIIEVVGRNCPTSNSGGITCGELVERMHDSFLDGIKSQKTFKEIKDTLRILVEFEKDLQRVKKGLRSRDLKAYD